MNRMTTAQRVMQRFLLVAGLAIGGLGAVAVRAETTGLVVTEVSGRVLARSEAGAYRGRVGPGFGPAAKDTILTGREARVELAWGEGGRWRVGQNAGWRRAPGMSPADAELIAGSALVMPATGETVAVAAAAATVSLTGGVWIVTAAANDGLKLVALDRGQARRGEVELELREGEVVFAPPGQAGFGPVVTIFLAETLATSRLVAGYSTELPGLERLRLRAAAQREALRHVSNAFVGDARDEGAFQLVVPKGRAEARAE